MEISIPKNWIEVDKETFDDVLKHENYFRDGYSGGVYVINDHTKKRIGGYLDKKGEPYKWFLNPVYFKRV